ncbi:hypothetical protein EMIT0194P_370014 [Pseudomonas serbica]|jgi:hypothetical protein
MPQLLGHFRFQSPLNEHFGELFEQTFFADQILWLWLIGQQAVSQFYQLGIGFDPFGALGVGH